MGKLTYSLTQIVSPLSSWESNHERVNFRHKWEKGFFFSKLQCFHSRLFWEEKVFILWKKSDLEKADRQSDYCLSLTLVHTIFLNNTLAMIVCLPMQIYQSSSLVVLVLLAFCHRLEAQPSKQSTLRAAGTSGDLGTLQQFLVIRLVLFKSRRVTDYAHYIGLSHAT